MCNKRDCTSVISDSFDNAKLIIGEDHIRLKIDDSVAKEIERRAITSEQPIHNRKKVVSEVSFMWIDNPNRRRKEINVLFRNGRKSYCWQFPLVLFWTKNVSLTPPKNNLLTSHDNPFTALD